MKTDTMRDRFVSVVTELLDSNPKVALVMADISTDRFKSNGAIDRHPHRVVNVGIREQLMVNVAAGMALEGMRPIAHSFAPFVIERSFEQVKLGFSHQGVGGILVSAGASYDIAAYGRTHESPGDVALVATLPDWRIHVPGHPDEAETFLRDAIASDDAVYIRLSERKNAAPAAIDGKLVVQRRGAPGAPAIIAVGPMLDPAMEAAETFDATVLYAATVRPFDRAGLRAAVDGTDVVLVEPYLEGTSAAEVAAALSHVPHRLLSIGVPRTEHRKYGAAAQHDEAHGLDAPGLRTRIAAWLHQPRHPPPPERVE
ncbi:MAG: transketolase C-terminal domain-containing protein [Dehalococcoidia bacterium]